MALARLNTQWTLTGADDASTEKLITLNSRLARGIFPLKTQGIEHYGWTLAGQGTGTVRRRWVGTRQEEMTVRIGLDLVDWSGEISGDAIRHAYRRELVDNLERTRGILVLFDPIGEFNRGDAY